MLVPPVLWVIMWQSLLQPIIFLLSQTWVLGSRVASQAGKDDKGKPARLVFDLFAQDLYTEGFDISS